MSSMDSRQERVTTPSFQKPPLLKYQSKTQMGRKEEDNHSEEEHLGAGMNVVSETAVERLGLKTENHPTPYRISWVNEANSVLVKQRCLVKFSLGKKYMDEAWCDVIPMTVCHMLLGCPWLYDRKVLYDGYANTYSFTFKVLNEGYVLLMIIKREVKRWTVIFQEFTAMLEEFQDIMSGEMSNQLPPMREVQHAIDLIPGSTLPNLPHYRMNKGFIQESLTHVVRFYSHQRRMVVGGCASIAEQLIR
ncbi:hypothetical protein AAG906_016988 [Vitis piasezkii]